MIILPVCLLNTAGPSGKLARWALTIQEMDITIKHKSGKKNTNADALSRCPADESCISAVVEDLQDGNLPEEEKSSRRIILESKQFEVVEGVLYHENLAFPGRWCIVAPKKLRAALLEEAHQGRFAGPNFG